MYYTVQPWTWHGITAQGGGSLWVTVTDRHILTILVAPYATKKNKTRKERTVPHGSKPNRSFWTFVKLSSRSLGLEDILCPRIGRGGDAEKLVRMHLQFSFPLTRPKPTDSGLTFEANERVQEAFAFVRFIDNRLYTGLTVIQNKEINK